MLQSIADINIFKKSFYDKLKALRTDNVEFDSFLCNILTKNSGYVVGGFLRDVANNQNSRDIDIVFDIEQEDLIQHINSSGLHYKVNRMSGIKISLDNFEADIWTLNNNWAFKSKAIKRNDEHILESLANGCFYNYDSLVINIRKGIVNVKNYNNLVNTNQLDILRRGNLYKNRNPTLEANIIRALYIKKRYKIDFSENCLNYLGKKILELNSNFDDTSTQINNVKIKYEKYAEFLTKEEIFKAISEICYSYGVLFHMKTPPNQISLNL